MDNKIKYQTIPVTVAAATATLKETAGTLDKLFKRCIGVSVIKKSGPETWRLGIKNSAGTVLDRVYSTFHLFGTECPVEGRVRKLNMPAMGENITIDVEPTAALAADLTLDVVFHLTNEDEACGEGTGCLRH